MGKRRPAKPPTDPSPVTGQLRYALALDSIDLHGDTVARARTKLKSFLQRSLMAHRGEVVRIITGKGRHSEGPARLVPAVEEELGRLPAFVAEWETAPDGGSILVRLTDSPPPRP